MSDLNENDNNELHSANQADNQKTSTDNQYQEYAGSQQQAQQFEQPQNQFNQQQNPQVQPPFGQQQYNQQQYGQQNQYEQSQYQYSQYQQPTQPKKKYGLAVAAMVLGIVSALLLCLYPLALAIGIVGLVLGIIALKNKYDGKGMAITGVILSAISILFSTLVIIGCSVFSSRTSDRFWNEIFDELDEYGYDYEYDFDLDDYLY